MKLGENCPNQHSFAKHNSGIQQGNVIEVKTSLTPHQSKMRLPDSHLGHLSHTHLLPLSERVVTVKADLTKTSVTVNER